MGPDGCPDRPGAGLRGRPAGAAPRSASGSSLEAPIDEPGCAIEAHQHRPVKQNIYRCKETPNKTRPPLGYDNLSITRPCGHQGEAPAPGRSPHERKRNAGASGEAEWISLRSSGLRATCLVSGGGRGARAVAPVAGLENDALRLTPSRPAPAAACRWSSPVSRPADRWRERFPSGSHRSCRRRTCARLRRAEAAGSAGHAAARVCVAWAGIDSACWCASIRALCSLPRSSRAAPACGGASRRALKPWLPARRIMA